MPSPALLDAIADAPPIWFTCGGAPFADLAKKWRKETRTERTDKAQLRHVTWSDPATGLRVVAHVKLFDDFPAADWVVELHNAGREDTPILENILPLKVPIEIPPEERLVLHHAKGSLCQVDDFLPQESELFPGGKLNFAPRGGRSSNGTLPFMNLQRRGGGLVLGIGWSGQWGAWFERDKSGCTLKAGMERTHLRLRPDERIRTPRILLLHWEGTEPEVGQNLLRRLLAEHYLPRLDGKPVMPPVATCLQAYYYLTGKAGEEFEMAALPKAAKLGVEVYWIDACWYGRTDRQWWEEVGSWVINRERFPHGLKPIADAAHRAGMKFLLWFEPERVRPESLLHKEHPEFLLSAPGRTDNFLFNLGLPEARRHLTDLLSKLISEIGIDIYRQDFNFDPLPYWQAADAPDRTGMAEIRYTEGFYELWDELRRRHPRIWIDNCASGGRRIDLETLSRSLPLWPSDYCDMPGLRDGLGLHVGDQCMTLGLARWAPLMGGGMWNFEPYGARSQMIGGFTFGFHIPREAFAVPESMRAVTFKDVLARSPALMHKTFPMALARRAIREWKGLRPFFLGDLHLLLPLTASPHDWCAYQYHRPALDDGFAMFFRRHASPFGKMEVELRWIDPKAKYEVSLSANYRESPRKRMTGQRLGRLTIAIPDKPGSVLLRYRRMR